MKSVALDSAYKGGTVFRNARFPLILIDAVDETRKCFSIASMDLSNVDLSSRIITTLTQLFITFDHLDIRAKLFLQHAIHSE